MFACHWETQHMVGSVMHKSLDAFRFYFILFSTPTNSSPEVGMRINAFPKVFGSVVFIGRRLFLQERQP